jgi:hypothetical protein
MRWKIIAVNSAIVLLVGLLSFAMLRASLGDLASNQTPLRSDAEHSLAAANGKLELDALRTERWLANIANEKASRDVYKAGMQSARQEEATEYSNRVLSTAIANPIFQQSQPTLVAVIDQGGLALGRNGTNLMRGEDVGAAHPSLKAAIAKGTTASDVWADAKTAQLMSVSYAPVRDDDRRVLGMLVIGTPLNDERLQRTSELTSGRWLILGIPSGANLDLKAKSVGLPGALIGLIGAPPLKDQVLATIQSGRGAFLTGGPSDVLLIAAPLNGYGDGRQAVLIAVTPSSLIESVSALLYLPVLGVMALGLLLVLAGGFLLGNYLSRPIEELEEGLLAILNGKTDLRFEIEHAELGGLVFRLNSLLNQLMGVQEDDTDEEGRPSRPPAAADFSEALALDDGAVAAQPQDGALVAALRAESPQAYYQRLFAEYIAAKRSVGDPVDHITEPSFTGRIRASEQEMLEKHGKAVRYRVEVRGREVVLLAVPLS